ncbi:hypothetical protein MTZ49_01565 [Entomomonas sp. E2T0]|uniref:hypothetical protein n=1 Tax=Entomomonas sp. E2T0 TaxID=2930213 RepID=UPI0022283661|nr:hypothetical protein [Entomomonas sp. E2T0]UYZ84295.1 hypothetical protein MTZ49_01565 [Entomomonas sp. E2T0]
MACKVTPERLKPQKNTRRIVEWNELPPSTQQVQADLNPLAKGILMAHQVEYMALDAPIIVAEKGRRTGITFVEALIDTLVAASSKQAGGMNVYYIGDTKEKGLEFIGYVAKFARSIAKVQKLGVTDIEEFLFEDQDENGNSKYITSYRIRFGSGFQVVALSSNPANIRGLQGKVVIDEAAFHGDVQAVIDAATALLIWGGKIRIISTHNGIKNPFNQLINDIKGGKFGNSAIVYKATFDDAVTNGLYERVCLMTNETPTAQGKEEWYTTIRSAYGSRAAAMLEELDCIPRAGTSIALPSIWIDNAMREVRPVLRWSLDKDFEYLPVSDRVSYGEDWIHKYIDPVLKEYVDPTLNHVFAQDYARHRDFSVIGTGEISPILELKVPFVVEMHKVPKMQQVQIASYIIENLPRFTCAAIDATGNGQGLAEDLADLYSREYVHQINITRNFYKEWTQPLIDLFESGFIDIPRDNNLSQDLLQITEIDGVKMIPAIRAKDLKEPELYRHADSAAMFILLRYAMLNQLTTPFNFQALGITRSSIIDNHIKTTVKGWGTVTSGTNYRGYND